MPVSMIDRVPTTNWYLYLFVWLHRSHKDTLVNRKKEKRWLRWAYCINFNIETRSASETHIAIQSTIHLFLSARTKCIKVWMYGRWNWIFPWDESRRRKKNVSDGIDSYAGPEREWGAHAALEHTANEISTIHMRECMCIVLPSYLFNVSISKQNTGLFYRHRESTEIDFIDVSLSSSSSMAATKVAAFTFPHTRRRHQHTFGRTR